MKLFNDYSKIASKVKYRSIYGEGLEILTPKKMLQRLPIPLAQVEAGNTSKKIQQYNEFDKVIKYNGYYIYEF